MSTLRLLILALLVAAAGCTTREPPPPPPPPVVVPEETWRQVDRDILAASRDAARQAEHFARELMERWMDLVYRRTETDFIPWFSSYWTRQWLTLKVARYRMDDEAEKEQAVERLALYLQEEYQARVLAPVAQEIDPDRITRQATNLYVWVLGEQLRKIPQRYGVPQDQFERRLRETPAIALALPGGQSASLYQIVHTEPPGQLPAYAALIERVRQASAGASAGPSGGNISPLARRTSERLMTELATSSAASALSAMVGRAAGMLISLGAAGVNSLMHESERPELEAQLRKTVNDAFDEKWLELMRSPDSGVLAGVRHIEGRIEESRAGSATLPAQSEPALPDVALPGGPALPPRAPGDAEPYRLW